MPDANAFTPHGEKKKVPFDVRPQECPLCHHALDPRWLDAATLTGNPDTEGTFLEIAYQCTRPRCARLFIGRYKKGDAHALKLHSVAPVQFREPTIPDEVADISPQFKRIYTQASQADSQELDEIAGVGYRKALEFLVKDYCISEKPDEADQIRKEFLGSCIEKRVEDTHLKECAKRAAWLGNDETHYVRRWEDKDIQDLKILIELTTNWIRSSVLSKRYLDDMEPPGSQE